MGQQKQFNFHLQFNPRITESRAVYVTALTRMIENSTDITGSIWSDGDKKGSYVNLNVMVERPLAFWRFLMRQITSNPTSLIPQIMIATCQGKAGWDDYLLLHHFDQKVQLDTFSPDRIEVRA
jgi:hypothetical protein